MSTPFKLHRGIKKFKNVLFCLTVLSLFALIIFYSLIPGVYYEYFGPRENVSCHYVNTDDLLLSIEDASFSPPEQSIYFHETSCRGGLNARQACSVETAARAHPGWRVHVVFSSPVSENALYHGPMALLRQLTNIHFLRVHILDYVANTPVEGLVQGGALNHSHWPISHTSDLLRYLTLYKWGGLYLDLDVLVGKPLAGLGPNWAARESDSAIASAVLAFSRDDIGKKFAEAAIRNFAAQYRGDIWGHNGPGVITRILRSMCYTRQISIMSADVCQGFQVYDADHLFPIPWQRAKEYFEPGYIDLETPYTYHVWNKVSHDFTVSPESRYMKMVQKFCPSIYKIYGDEITSGSEWAK